MAGSFTQDTLPTSGIGCTDVEVVDVSNKNEIPEALNCRFFHVDVSGIVKIDFRDDTGNEKTEVLQANGGTPCLRRNIIKVYQNYAKGSPMTAKIFNQHGTLVNGIKLCR